jgi:hypothetical protein
MGMQKIGDFILCLFVAMETLGFQGNKTLFLVPKCSLKLGLQFSVICSALFAIFMEAGQDI